MRKTKFKEVKEAYDVLSDDQKRAHMTSSVMWIRIRASAAAAAASEISAASAIYSICSSAAAAARRNPNAPQRGNDLQYTMTIEFKEAVFGKETDITIPRTESAITCHGSARSRARSRRPAPSAAEPDSRKSYRIRRSAELSIAASAPTCNGQGKIIKEKCGTCHGSGKVKKQRKIHVKIPAGVDEGAQIRVTGEGEGGLRGGPPGDLYIVIRVKSHEFFEREGDDIYCEVPLTFAQAALGDEIEIPTLTEKVKLKIPRRYADGNLFPPEGQRGSALARLSVKAISM